MNILKMKKRLDLEKNQKLKKIKLVKRKKKSIWLDGREQKQIY